MFARLISRATKNITIITSVERHCFRVVGISTTTNITTATVTGVRPSTRIYTRPVTSLVNLARITKQPINHPRRHHMSTSNNPRTTPTTPNSNKNMAINIDTTYKLPSGHSIPALGFGVYQTPASECKAIVLEALQSGYRHVDSARAYRNESPCAEAIRESGLSRDQIFFTSKVPPGTASYEDAKKAIDASLQQTGLDYFDLYLIHAPYGGKKGRLGSWRALVEAQKAGKIRSIGISNYGVHHLDELEEYITSSGPEVGGKIDVGQWELHPWLPHEDIVAWARQRGVVVQAWSPLVRAERAHEPILTELGQKHNKTWAQILIRWSLQKGYVPLPKSVRREKLVENTQVYDFELSDEDMRMLEFPGSYAPCSWDPTVSRD